MSDSEDSIAVTRSGKKTRLSAVKRDDSMHTEGSGDDNDDSVSVGASSVADDSSSRCGTPTHPSKKQKRGKGSKFAGRCKLQYKCTNNLKEDHGQPVFGVQFNHNTRDGDPLIFATVGSNRVTIYECQEGGKIKLMQAYMDNDSEENFYTCAWTYDEVTGQPLLAVSGARAVIRIISPVTMQCVKHFIGPGQAINELKFHPKNPNVLLSVSKDHSLQLWNIKTDVCIAIFGGVDGHRDEVLSGDINMEATMVVSCGMDHSVKIWRLDKPAIQKAIEYSYTYNPAKTDKPFPTVLQNYPDFSTRDIHLNYVDCARWLGRFILSKSCENRIVCWKPGKLWDLDYTLKPTDSTVSVLHQFDLKDCDIWFMRFSMDYWQKILAVGNQIGRVFIWDVDVDDPSLARCTTLIHSRCSSAIRQTSLSRDGSILICVCDNGTLWRWDRQR